MTNAIATSYNSYLEAFLEKMLVENSIAQNTYDAYRRDIQEFIRYILTNKINIESLDSMIIDKYIKYLHGQSHKTIARKTSSLRQFLLFLSESGILHNELSRNLTINRAQEAQLVKALSRQEIDAIFDIAMSDTSPLGTRNYTLLQIIYSTGMRISEVVNLKIQQVVNMTYQSNANRYIASDNSQSDIANDRIQQYFTILGKGSKERIAILNKNARRALSSYLDIRHKCFDLSVLNNKDLLRRIKANDFLFPSLSHKMEIIPLSRQSAWLIIKKIGTLANIDPAKLSPHKIRHSFATHMIQNGMDIRILQEALGHSSIASTQIYTHMSAKLMEEATKKHPLSKKSLDDLTI